MNTIAVIGALLASAFLINYALDTLGSTVLGACMAIVFIFILAISPFAIIDDAIQIKGWLRTRRAQAAHRRGDDFEDPFE